MKMRTHTTSIPAEGMRGHHRVRMLLGLLTGTFLLSSSVTAQVSPSESPATSGSGATTEPSSEQPTVTAISAEQLAEWAASGETVTIPPGTVFVVTLPDGGTVVLQPSTVFSLGGNGGIPRFNLVQGTAVVQSSPTGETGSVEIAAGGTVINATSASVAVNVTAGTVSLSQQGSTGVVAVNGAPLPAGSGGFVTSTGFVESEDVKAAVDEMASAVVQVVAQVTPTPPPAAVEEVASTQEEVEAETQQEETVGAAEEAPAQETPPVAPPPPPPVIVEPIGTIEISPS
jgi:hypothetical protein